MTTLLAKELINRLNELAGQAGLEIECDIQNFYLDEQRAGGCEGEVRCPKTGAKVGVLSHVSWISAGRIRFITPHHVHLDEINVVDVVDAAEKIVGLLTLEPITHNNLGKSCITNLPSLGDNPLLATYLCDASTSTATWTTGRKMLEHTILRQGFNLSHYTDYPRLHDAANEVANVLWRDLAQNCTEGHMVCHHLLAYHDVQPSETIAGRITYFQDDAKRAAGIRTPIKVRKYLRKFFKDFRGGEELERIAKALDGLMQGTDKWDVRTLDHDDVDGWDEAFNKIRSCMSRASEHGVGVRNSYLCYMTKYHGLDDNGVRLTVLYQDGKPVARTLTYENEYGKHFVRNYGDDRLVRWLDDNGYNRRGTLPLGTLLYTWVYDGNDRDDDYAFDLVHPYLDGKNDRVDIITESGKLAFVIQNEGDELADASGSLVIDHRAFCCSHCRAFADTKVYPKYLALRRGTDFAYLCKDCEKDNVVTVDVGTPYEKTVYSKYLGRDMKVYNRDGGTFTLRGLQHLGFTVVD